MGKSCGILFDIGTMLYTLTTNLIEQQTPQSKKISILGISNKVKREFLSQLVKIILRFLLKDILSYYVIHPQSMY